MKLFKRSLALLLVLVSIAGVFAIPASAAGSANSRINTFLNLAAGEQITDEDISNLTSDQLLFLGIYLSNFFQPFGTEFGDANDEIAANCREDMIEALQTQLKFSDAMANALVDTVIEMTRETATKLKVYYKEGDEYKEVNSVNTGFASMSPNYFNYFRSMIGETDRVYGTFARMLGFSYEDGCNWLTDRVDSSVTHYPVNSADVVYPADGVRPRAARADSYVIDASVIGDHNNVFKKVLNMSDDECYTNRIYLGDWVYGNTRVYPNGQYDEAWFNHQEWLWKSLNAVRTDGADADNGGWTGYSPGMFYISDSKKSSSLPNLNGYTLSEEEFKEFLIKLYIYITIQAENTQSVVMHNPLYYYLENGDYTSYKPSFSKEYTNDSSWFFTVYWIADTLHNGYQNSSYGSGELFAVSTKSTNGFVSMGFQEPPNPAVDGTTSKTSIIGSSVLEITNWAVWEEVDFLYRMFCPTASNPINKLYWGYERDGSVTIVSDCTTTNALYGGSEYTPSQVEFFKCLETVNMSEGYGTNMFDFNGGDNQDGEWDADQLQVVLDRLASDNVNQELALKSSMFGAEMAVDCFGNIICMGANHQYVVIPACMNPFVWQAVDANGVDVGSPGSFMNLVNAVNITQADKGGVASVESCHVNVNKNGQDISSQERLHYTGKIANIGATGYTTFGELLTAGSLTTQSVNWFSGTGDLTVVPARHVRGQDGYLITDNSFWAGGEDVAVASLERLEGCFEEIYPCDFSFRLWVSQDQDGELWWNNDYIILVYDPWQVYSWSEHNANYINILDGYVFVDNLGVYKNPDGSDRNFSALNVEHYLAEDGTPAGAMAGGMDIRNPFGSSMDEIMSGSLNDLGGASEQALCSIYISYIYAFFYEERSKADTIGRLGYRIAKENLPTVRNEYIDVDLSHVTADIQSKSIQDWTYYLLHPTDGYEYVTTLISNKLNHLLLGWHSDMVGTNGVGVTAGTTKYRSTVGYVTMPDLSEIGWTDKLISFYQDCIPFLIVIIFVLMLFAFITGMLTLQRAAMAAILFSAFLFLPTTLINGTVQLSNTISQRVYGEKFAYWAMVQQETYATKIDEAANVDGSSGNSSYENYLRTLYSLNQKVYSNQGSESILLKWQAPKKMASLVLTTEDARSLDGLDEVGRSMLYGMLDNAYGGQSYVDDENAVYMYRSYIDISNFSRYIYSGVDSGKVSSTHLPSQIVSVPPHMIQRLNNLAIDYASYRDDGYTNWGLSESSATPNYKYITVPMSSRLIREALATNVSLLNTKDELVPINQDLFSFGLPMFTNDTVNFDFETFAATAGIFEEDNYERYNTLKKDMTEPRNLLASTYSPTEEDYVGAAAYALYSENPYYYFSWKLYHDGLGYSSSLSNRNGYKNLLLSKEDGGYFYMNEVGWTGEEPNGGLKDFMDMKSLFTYIIPYMKEGNDIVRAWDERYGIFIYDGVPTEEGHWGDVAGDPELQAKYWHNLNVSRLYCIYSPWVDIMYDCSYAEPETITVMGKRHTISDPLNPLSYPNERPMIFSEAEMRDYGLSEADLTKVERLILKCNEEFQERMFELLNYYNFSDITLNSSAAMQCAFAFNTTFSETGVMTENHNIYPQSFDLANFSYDAFLRFILSESTGESLTNTSITSGTSAGKTTGDFYERLVNNSSTTTAILLLVLDVFSVYVIPAFKIFFLIAAFISSLLIVFVSLCKIEENAKFVRKAISGFFLPLIEFFAVTVGFSLIISLFMGKGNNAVTQTDTLSISLGDPVIAILIMLVLDIIMIILYWKILKNVLKDIKFNGKLAFSFAGGVLGAVGGMAVGAISSATRAAKEGVENSVGYHRYRQTRKDIKKSGKSGDTGDTQKGTGVESSRAAQRGSVNVEDREERKVDQHRDSSGAKPKRPNETKPQDNSEEKRRNLDQAARSGVDNLQHQAEEARNARFEQYRRNAERDFGYARGEDGKIDTSKLSARDRYKYESRVKRTAQRESEIEFGTSSRKPDGGKSTPTKPKNGGNPNGKPNSSPKPSQKPAQKPQNPPKSKNTSAPKPKK